METDPRLVRLWELLEPIAIGAGLELVDIEHRRERAGDVLRLLLDKPGGVSLDELSGVSREVSDVLDVHDDALPGRYTLEVSSPGINRPLTRPAHFQAYLGKRVHVRTRTPLADRHNFRGVLGAVSPASIVIQGDDGSSHTIPFAAIARANYQHDFATPARGPGRRAARSRAR